MHVHFTPAQYIPVYMHLSQMHTTHSRCLKVAHKTVRVDLDTVGLVWVLMHAIKCDRNGCTGSCPPSVVERCYQAGGKPATCWMCGHIFPKPNGADTNDVSGPCASQRVQILCRHVRSRSCVGIRTHSEVFLRVLVLQESKPGSLVLLLRFQLRCPVRSAV